MSSIKIKICGMTKVDEVAAICQLDINAIGVILHANSPRVIDIDCAKAIRDVVPASIKMVGVVVNAEQSAIESFIEQIGLDLIQLHGDENNSFGESLSRPFVKAIRPKSLRDANLSVAQYPSSTAILLDPFVDGQYGGTGHTLNQEFWPDQADKPLILAGGLNPENVKARALALTPCGVDINSGVEHSPGRKDMNKVSQAVSAVREIT